MTKNPQKYVLIMVGIALGSCTAAYGLAFRPAPEIDPGIAVSALTLLGGAIAVLRVRRKK